MQACFSDQINPPTDSDRPDPPRTTVAVYVDDIVIKTPRTDDLVATLNATFAKLKRFNIKLNPEKCTFGVPKGKLLGYMVSERGIEANHNKIASITNMGPIRGVKGVQTPEVNRVPSSPQSIHCSTGRARSAAVQAPQEV